MKVITTEGSYDLVDYSQLSYEDGICVIEEFDLASQSISERQVSGKILAIVDIN